LYLTKSTIDITVAKSNDNKELTKNNQEEGGPIKIVRPEEEGFYMP
jgi:hypothetical protein